MNICFSGIVSTVWTASDYLWPATANADRTNRYA